MTDMAVVLVVLAVLVALVSYWRSGEPEPAPVPHATECGVDDPATVRHEHLECLPVVQELLGRNG